MSDDAIDVEVVPNKVVRCPRCGARNRLVRQERDVGYRCGNCWTALANPFARFVAIKRCFEVLGRSRTSQRMAKFIATVVVAIVAFALVMHHEPPPGNGTGLVTTIPQASVRARPSVAIAPAPQLEGAAGSPPLGSSPVFPPPKVQLTPSQQAARSLALRTPLPPPRSLENGTILVDVINAGHGIFTVDNSTDRDAVVKLVDQSKGQTVVAIYVRAHDSATVDEIPEGVFTVLCGQGVDWDESINFFTRKRAFEKFQPDLDFTTTLKRTGDRIIREYKNISLGLAPTIGGEMRESDMSENSFMEY